MDHTSAIDYTDGSAPPHALPALRIFTAAWVLPNWR